ncbi:hypothetical protein AA0535_2651 [Asaia krungthepensis NRIC 0535]|uniref:Uncharacterized protein n=1 Tax=Asaia krungthepensis NRIC 0535 TaxID=1307925 RepID=A0ABQ0Q5T5_9PROT|nr:hypothetical protein AA0535_2651 [Asaia krungthepensis NRIC 0535]
MGVETHGFCIDRDHRTQIEIVGEIAIMEMDRSARCGHVRKTLGLEKTEADDFSSAFPFFVWCPEEDSNFHVLADTGT